MNYQEFRPDNRLKNIIACYWVINFSESESQYFEDVILPDGCYDFIINQGSEYERLDLTTNEKTTVREYALIGQRKKAVIIYQSSETNIFAVRFKPDKINTLLKISPVEIINEIVTERGLKQNYIDPIRKILGRKSGMIDKLNLINEVFVKRLMLQSGKQAYLSHAISTIISEKGKVNLTRYCAEKQIHKSTLEKAFKKSVGICPKEFSSIIRFNNSCALIHNGGITNLAGVAIESGYYDQAHLCKEFKKFTNSSPKEFFTRNFILPQTGIAFQNAWPSYF